METGEPLPDYYAKLQVHPSAEPEIIEAAFRRLIRKYHPDALPEEKRQDPEILCRVREINVAYDVLRDPEQRAAYVQVFEPGSGYARPGSQRRGSRFPPRCSISRSLPSRCAARRSPAPVAQRLSETVYCIRYSRCQEANLVEKGDERNQFRRLMYNSREHWLSYGLCMGNDIRPEIQCSSFF